MEYTGKIIIERIKFAAKMRNTSAKQMLIDLGMNKDTVNTINKSMIKADRLANIADYLNVSMDYLMGRTDIPELQKMIPQEQNE